MNGTGRCGINMLKNNLSEWFFFRYAFGFYRMCKIIIGCCIHHGANGVAPWSIDGVKSNYSLCG